MGGTEDRTEGAWDKAKGKVKEGVGDATDNPSLENEGKTDQVKAKIEKVGDDVKDVFTDK